MLLVFALVARAQSGGAPKAVPGQIVLRVPKGAGEDQARAMAEAAGCRLVEAIAFSPGYYLLETKTTSGVASVKRSSAVTPEVQTAVAQLKAVPGALAEPNWLLYPTQQTTPPPATLTPNDPLLSLQNWHLSMINMPRAWALQRGTRPVVVAVVDTGIDTNHPDLAGQIDPRGRNFSSFDPNDVSDLNGHGTHVAGTIAASTNNGTGVASVAGWERAGVDVRILPVRVFTGDEGAPTSTIISGFNYAVIQRVDVINLSLGGFLTTLWDEPIQDALAAGIVVVAAAGNEASGFPVSPADNFGAIKVSAVDNTRKLAVYSNFSGSVAIAAPGGGGPTSEEVVSTWPFGLDLPAPAPYQNGYRGISGTSMAAPHVAGAAALLKAAGVNDPFEIRFILQVTAQPLPDDTPNFSGGNKYGAGLLDVAAALDRATRPGIDLVAPSDQTVTMIRKVTVTVRIRNADRLDDNDIITVTIRPINAAGGNPITLTRTGAEIPDSVTPIDITFPEQTLTEGRYTVEVTLQSVIPDSESAFLTVTSRTQPVGRTMFAVPFVVQDQFGGREVSLFGTDASFLLRRWDPLTAGYASYSSTGVPQDSQASFRPVGVNNTSISYDTANPGRDIAPVGLGFWLDLDSSPTLNITGQQVTTPVGIRLVAEKVGPNGQLINPAGWNMIGDPFPYVVDWSAVSVRQGQSVYTVQEAADKGIIKNVLVGYAAGGYVFSFAPNGSLQPFNGYWVRALQDCDLIIPPLPGAGRASVKAEPAPGAAGGWRARLIATVAGDRDAQNYFGQVLGADAGEDRFDVAKPPSGAGHAYVRFLPAATKSDARANPFAYDMRPAGSKKEEWAVAVTTDRDNADVTLSWEGLAGLPRRARLTLTDTVTGKKIALRSRSSYAYKSGEAGETRRFTLTMDSQPSGGPLAIAGLRTTSGRAVAGVSVRFTLNQDADVTGRILTLGGKPLARLSGDGRASTGAEAVLRWSGRDEKDAVAPPGPYLVEVTARGPDGQTARVKQPIMLLR